MFISVLFTIAQNWRALSKKAPREVKDIRFSRNYNQNPHKCVAYACHDACFSRTLLASPKPPGLISPLVVADLV
jgi:hypothetical protein